MYVVLLSMVLYPGHQGIVLASLIEFGWRQSNIPKVFAHDQLTFSGYCEGRNSRTLSASGATLHVTDAGEHAVGLDLEHDSNFPLHRTFNTYRYVVKPPLPLPAPAYFDKKSIRSCIRRPP